MGSLPGTTMKKFTDDLTAPDEREFELGGELYRWRYPHWEEMAAIFDEDVEKMQANTNGQIPKTVDSIEMVIERTKLMLEPDSATRLDAAVARKENPIPIGQYQEVYRWLLEVTSGRPTKPSSDSAGGAGAPAASSRGRSS